MCQPVLDLFLHNPADVNPSDFNEKYNGHSLMYYLSAGNYPFPKNLWGYFPYNLSKSTIKELVLHQSWFLAKVITSKESRNVILQISPSLLLYLDVRFGKNVIGIPQGSSFLSTEFDRVDRTCTLFWMEKYNLSLERIPQNDLKYYHENIKPMLCLKRSGSIKGSGATSHLYQCLYKNSKHALKIISEPSLSSGKQEIKILKLIGSHPNICGMVDSCVYSSSIKIVLPLYESDLRQTITNSSVFLPVKTVVLILRSILKALSYLDSKRIIHGDVKPANILLKGSEVALCDFGLSRQLPEGKDFCTEPCYGTVAYLSPERHKRCFGPKTDVYSLGIVFYELLYGSYPKNNDKIEYPISKRIPEAVRSILVEMLKPVHERPFAAEILEETDWKAIEDEVLKESDQKHGKHTTTQTRTILPGPHDSGLRISDKRIGKGAFGEVYEGTFQYTNKKNDTKSIKVAVKKIPRSKDETLALNEIKKCQRIKPYKHLCRVYKCSEDKEYFYIAMELCPWNYRLYMHYNEDSEVLHLHLEQILKGIKRLHVQGIVHRDLKPENILVSATNTIKITDFGLSKALSSIGNTNAGTTFYKAPEIYTGNYGEEVDIWAIGVIYLDMLGMNVRKEFREINMEDAGVNEESKCPSGEFESVWDSNHESSSAIHRSNEEIPVDRHGRPLKGAFGPDGWVPKLHELVKNSEEYEELSKEFLLSIFVPASDRPSAHELLKKYEFTKTGLSYKQISEKQSIFTTKSYETKSLTIKKH